MKIAAIGLAPGERRLDQEHAARLAGELCCDDARKDRLLRAVYKRTTLSGRSVVLPEATGGEPFLRPGGEPDTAERMARYHGEAARLALRACSGALEKARWEPGSVTHLVTVSCTGFQSPGLDSHLAEALGLPATVERLNIGFMGCHGALNGLRAARGFAALGGRVLLCAVEICSVHFQYGWDLEQVTANALFADGAAAAACEPSSPEDPSPRLTATGANLFPGTAEEMGWRIGNHGFRMNLSPRVPRLIEENLRPWMEEWLAGEGLTVGEIGSWAIHPGGPRILDATARALGLSGEAMEPSWAVFRRHGNMSSPTVLFILEELRARQAALPRVALAFGPGLAAEGALVC